MPDAPFTPGFLIVKLADIGLITIYYFTIGLAFAKVFDNVYGKFDPEEYEKMSFMKLFGEIVLHIFILGVVAYIIRNLVNFIPFPLDGLAGFQHSRLKELNGGVVLATVLIFFQEHLKDKIVFFAEKYFKIVAEPDYGRYNKHKL